MNVEINKHLVEVPAGINSLEKLLELKGLSKPGTAVAIDNAVVPRAQWSATKLSEGLKITVISAVCGG